MAGQNLPVPVSRLLFRVSNFFAHDQYAQAADFIKEFRRKNNKAEYADHPEILFSLGNCCLAVKDYRGAARNYRKAITARPDHAPSWQNLANALYNSEEYAEAAKSFINAFDLQKKKNPELLYYSAECYLLAGKNAFSVSAFERLFNDFPQKIRSEWKEGMVRALIADGQNKKALPLIQELVSLYTKDKKKEWSQVLLYQYLGLGMNESARRLAFSLARHYPGEEQWWRAVVHVALEQGKMDDALMAMTIISFIHPLDKQETRLFADLNLQAGIPRKALPVYEKLLATSPSPVLLKYVVYASLRLGDKTGALALFEKYSDLTEQNFDLLMDRADLLYSLSRYQEAQAAYIQAAHVSISCKKSQRQDIKSPEEGRAWLMAGYCAWQHGDLQSAINAFSRAVHYPTQKKKAVEIRGYLEKMLKIS
jgi:tetratricopeptide (TPR) repeat protein